MKALVIYESLTGTTRRAAVRIARGLRAAGIETAISPANRVDHGALQEAGLVVVGSWTDGLVFVGQKPGRQARLWSLPFLTGKQAFAFCTYAVDAGGAAERLAAICRERGAEVLGSAAVHRFHLERDADSVVEQVLAAVPAPSR